MVGWMGWSEGVSLGDAIASAVIALITDTTKTLKTHSMMAVWCSNLITNKFINMT